MPREMRFPVTPPPQTLISGRCHVIDGDTIVIGNVHIRLAGIDAPELDHPWGQQAKWAMVGLCRGQTVTARIRPEMSYDRLVAECFLPDGRDLAAELVKAGLALDWPRFSGGRYRALEPPDARKKLWRASLRQGGMTWRADDGVPVRSVARPQAVPGRAQPYAPPRRASYRAGWLIVPAVLAGLVGCNLVRGDVDRQAAPGPGGQAAPAPVSR